MVVILYREAIEYFSNAIPSSELDLSLLSGIAGPYTRFFGCKRMASRPR